MLALPFGAVRSFAWNAGRPQLDPAPRYLPRPVVVDDTLLVAGPGGTIDVAGEDPRSRAAAAAQHDPAALAALGIGWVLVERGTPGPPPSAAVAALPRVVDGPWLTLLRVPDPVATPGPDPGVLALTIGAHLIAFGDGRLGGVVAGRVGGGAVGEDPAAEPAVVAAVVKAFTDGYGLGPSGSGKVGIGMRSIAGVAIALALGALLGVSAVFGVAAVVNPDVTAAQAEPATVTYGQR